jgi:hypothetical protein
MGVRCLRRPDFGLVLLIENEMETAVHAPRLLRP